MAHQRRALPVVLTTASLLLMSCLLSLFPPLTDTSGKGVLDVDIDYVDEWYRETFNYSREAKNIKHFVLVMPESEAARSGAGGIFTSITFQPDGSLTVRDDRQEYAWALDYVYEAPEGHFRGEFGPGTYAVAVAFIAAPLSREEAGVGEDTFLWPGVTGGGASTDYQAIEIKADETASITFHITDANGWACPWLYVFDGQTFERRTEILRNIQGRDLQRTEITPIGSATVVDGFIVLKVTEEKDEVTFIDALYLLVDGVIIRAEADQATATRVVTADGNYLIIHRGEAYEFRFRVPATVADSSLVSVAVTGYYIPESKTNGRGIAQ